MYGRDIKKTFVLFTLPVTLEGGRGGKRREGRGGRGRDWKGGEGVPECPNPELASLIASPTAALYNFYIYIIHPIHRK